MKLLRLDLPAFGTFTDFSLDFSASSAQFHLIYGPNEAGKSTTLRALRQLFYGIPIRSSDDFQHPYHKLRIGALLEKADGSQLEVVRRKGNKNTLLEPDEETPVAESLLAEFLGGVEQTAFETMFSLDHETLIRGGRAIVEGQGDVGQILFAAGSGVADYQQVLQRLTTQAEELFVPRGQVRTLNKAIIDFEQARRAVHDAQLPSADWKKHDQALQAAQQQLTRVDEQLHTTSSEYRRLERLLAALPLFSERRHLLQQLDALGRLPLLSPGFSQSRQTATMQLSSARDALTAANRSLKKITEEINDIHVPEALVSRAEPIERLQKNLGSYRKAESDTPGLIISRDQHLAAAAELLRQFRPDLQLSQAASLRLTRSEQLAIQALGNQCESLLKEQAQAQKQIAQAAAELLDCRQQLTACPIPPNPVALEDALLRARSQGELENQWHTAERAWQAAEKQAEMSLKQLRWCSGTLADVEALAVPSLETIDRFSSELQELDLRKFDLERQLKKHDSELTRIAQRLEQMLQEGDVPTEDDLLAARQRRASQWQQIRQAWLNEPLKKSKSNSPAPLDPDELAATFESEVQQADELSDRLRREAQRVAELAQLQSEQAAHETQREARLQDLQALAKLQAKWGEQWQEEWRALGITAKPPKDMRAWKLKHQEVVGQAAELRKLEEQCDACAQRLQAGKEELSRELQSLNEPAAGENESWAALLDRVKDVVKRCKAAQLKREKLEEQERQWAAQSKQAQAASEEAAKQWKAWKSQWKSAIEPLGLSEDATPDQANACLGLINDLMAKLHDADSFDQRVKHIAADGQKFREEVRRFAAQVLPEVAELPAEEAAESLLRELRLASKLSERKENLQTSLAEKEQAAETARRTIEQMEAKLSALCKEAGCEQADDLPALEQRVAQANVWKQELKLVEQRLFELGAGATLENFLHEVESTKADDLPNLIQQRKELCASLEKEKSNLHETVGSERTELAKMNGRAAAAEAAERAQGLLAEIESQAVAYTQLRLAGEVLRRAIERYRQRHEGAVLQRASELFAELTMDSFSSLRAEYDDEGRAVLVGVRPTGAVVPVSGMSEGTGDQLFLALRLASLDNYFDRHESLPVILDDILINFDDARSVAALQALTNCSTRAQFIYFTHHRHQLDLARSSLPDGTYHVHTLPTRTAEPPLPPTTSRPRSRPKRPPSPPENTKSLLF